MIDAFKQLIFVQGKQCKCQDYLEHRARLAEGSHGTA